MDVFALLDDAVANQAVVYQQYIQSQFLSAHELVQLDHYLLQGWQQGWHVLLSIDYEFGLPLVKLSAKHNGYLTLHWFKHRQVISSAVNWLHQHIDDEKVAGIFSPSSDTDENTYLDSIHQIQAAISRGETYQINYTKRLHIKTYGCPIKLYSRLRQRVPYGGLAYLPNFQGQNQWTLSFSPELFLAIDSDGIITTEPMKGTAPILNDGHDQMRAEALQKDPKNRAENIMIVDLLRNDLGKIAQIGHVQVPEPFQVRRFGQVWQMTTTIQAKAKTQTTMADILAATFPSGSITGAPKRMSMEMINLIEPSLRHLYTGSLGWLEPCKTGLGFHGCLNVAIRTLQLKTLKNEQHEGVFGVGSGIVADSLAKKEYEECQWKASFITKLPAEFELFETLLVEHGQCRLLQQHFNRLEQSAKSLNFEFNARAIKHAIDGYLAQLPNSDTYRLKIRLSPQHGIQFQHDVYQELTSIQYVMLATEVLPIFDALRRFKTSNRQQYDQGWYNAVQKGAFDALFFNENGHLLEGGRSNVFIRLNHEWHTPKLSLNILNGIMRQQIMAQPQHYLSCDYVHESLLTAELLRQADEIRLSNALRGLFSVKLI